MINETIKELEQKIKQSSSISEQNQKELIALLAELKSEIVELAKTKKEAAESIAGFTKLSTHEATRLHKNPKLLELSLKGLTASVAGFEVSHPKLVQWVNSICVMLAKMGI